MRIVVPYVEPMLNPDTRAAVERSGIPHTFAQLDPADTGAYGRLFRRLWQIGETFIICEQDIVPTYRQLWLIRWCSHAWCCFRYDDDIYPDGPMFGLSRFSATAMHRYPQAAEDALLVGKRKWDEAPWWNIDSLMARNLEVRGARCVLHSPPVHHVHKPSAYENVAREPWVIPNDRWENDEFWG